MIKLFAKMRGKAGLIPLAIMVILFVGLKPPSPPTIVQEGIKIATWKATNEGWEISWEVEDDRISVGDDTFIIQMCDRQIPARRGYGAWREVGRTKALKFEKKEFIRARDVMLRIAVDKGAISEE